MRTTQPASTLPLNATRHRQVIGVAILGWLALIPFCRLVQADDWITWSSSYTHAENGQRVDQYTYPVQPIAPPRGNFQRSGYRHFRSSLQVGQSADNMHVVEQWGRPIEPYEQWRFPFRPYGVPYELWGPQPPYGIVNGNFNIGAAGGFPGGRRAPRDGMGYSPRGRTDSGQGGYGPSRGFPLQPQYNNQPWFDGTYPSAPPLDPRSDEEFFYRGTSGNR